MLIIIIKNLFTTFLNGIGNYCVHCARPDYIIHGIFNSRLTECLLRISSSFYIDLASPPQSPVLQQLQDSSVSVENILGSCPATLCGVSVRVIHRSFVLSRFFEHPKRSSCTFCWRPSACSCQDFLTVDLSMLSAHDKCPLALPMWKTCCRFHKTRNVRSSSTWNVLAETSQIP